MNIDWIDLSIREVDDSVQAFHESFKEFTEKCDSMIKHMNNHDSIKNIVREAQVEAFEEVLDRFTKKEFNVKNLTPEVKEIMRSFCGVIEVWKGEEENNE